MPRTSFLVLINMTKLLGKNTQRKRITIPSSINQTRKEEIGRGDSGEFLRMESPESVGRSPIKLWARGEEGVGKGKKN